MEDPFPSKHPTIDIETGPARCGRCGRVFAHFVFEEIEGIVQLRCGDVVIPKIESNCLHCGWSFRWGIREREIEKMSVTYGDLLKAAQVYNPE